MDYRDVVGQTGTVVILVVDDPDAQVTGSAGGEEVGSHDNRDAVLWEILSAMSRGQNPIRADDGRSAEVVSVGTAEGGEVRQLTRSRILSTDDAGLDGWRGKKGT